MQIHWTITMYNLLLQESLQRMNEKGLEEGSERLAMSDEEIEHTLGPNVSRNSDAAKFTHYLQWNLR